MWPMRPLPCNSNNTGDFVHNSWGVQIADIPDGPYETDMFKAAE